MRKTKKGGILFLKREVPICGGSQATNDTSGKSANPKKIVGINNEEHFNVMAPQKDLVELTKFLSTGKE